jgi:signal transduction histidine kinase
MKRIKFIIVCTFLFILANSFSQSSKTDSIKQTISICTNDSIKVMLLFRLSNMYNYNLPESSIYYLNRALPLINKNNLRNERALYYQKMGNALIEQSKLEEGLESTFFALSIFDSLENNYGMAKAYNLIGNVYAENTNYDQALENFGKSLKLYELINDTENIVGVQGNIGITYHRMGNDFQAILILTQVIDYFENNDDFISAGVYLVYLAKSYYNQKRYTKANQLNLLAIHYLKNTSLHKFYGMACANVAQIKLKSEDHDEALKYNNLGLSILRKGNFKTEIKECYKIFADIYKKLGDLEKCVFYYDKYIELKDTILDESNNRMITQMQARFDLKQKQTEINLLKTETELKNSKLKQQRIIILTITLGFFFLSFLFYIHYTNRKKIKAKNTVLQRNEEEIKKQNYQLAELNATKNKFFSIIAHDLRGPFHGILGMSELLVKPDQDYSHEETNSFLKLIHQAANNAFNLLENLLEWSRTQTGKIDFKPIVFKVKSSIQTVINLTDNSAKAKQITLIDKVAYDFELFADFNMFNTILRNLITNAIKFTHRKGQISIEASQKNNEIEFAVSDTGIGMSEETMNKLFKISEKITSLGTESETGTGLGLLLCKEFVEKHGGKIKVESEPGKGSCFKFTLPLKDE